LITYLKSFFLPLLKSFKVTYGNWRGLWRWKMKHFFFINIYSRSILMSTVGSYFLTLKTYDILLKCWNFFKTTMIGFFPWKILYTLKNCRIVAYKCTCLTHNYSFNYIYFFNKSCTNWIVYRISQKAIYTQSEPTPLLPSQG